MKKTRWELARIMFVGRLDDGHGNMRWVGQPVDSFEDARGQVENLRYADADIIEVETLLVDGEPEVFEGQTCAWAPLGQGWSDLLL